MPRIRGLFASIRGPTAVHTVTRLSRCKRSGVGAQSAIRMRYVKDSPLELGHRPWQLRPPTPSLMVFAKGTFDPAAGDPAPFAAEQIPVTGEVFVDDDAQNAQRVPTDFALLKPKGECFVIGKAWAPGGRPASMVAGSFRIGPVEKSFAVVGDREWRGGLMKTISEPIPFVSMELSADRAFGGPGYAPNPFGKGAKEVDGKILLPNLEQPRDFVRGQSTRPDPILLGPQPMLHADRHRYAGTYDERYMRERWPWLPHDFDWRFFMEAHASQQLREGYWRGDERVEINGLHPTIPMIKSRLPAIVPRVFVQLTRGGAVSFEEVPLKLDTVIWDGDIAKLVCVWRGLIEVASDTLDEVQYIHVAHERLSGPHGKPAEHRARMDALLKEEDDEEKDAEGVAPPSLFDDEPETTEYQPDIVTPLTPEEKALEDQLDEAGKAAAEHDVPPEAEAAPPDPKAHLAELRAAGAELEPDLEEIALRPELPDEPDEVPEAPIIEDGRAILETLIARGEALTDLDLTGADLARMDLAGRDLSGTIFRGARMTEIKLGGAKLERCDLARADLSRADLATSNLSGADLESANLEWAELAEANLEDAYFEDAKLTGAKLPKVKAARATFTRADLTEAVLLAADFTEGDFERARLDRADAREAIFKDAVLEESSAEATRFDHAVMTKTRCEGMIAKGARFGSIDAEDSYWPRADVSKADFSLSKLTRADFSDAVLLSAEMDGCALRQARFDRANAHSLKARRADMMEAIFDSANLSFADLRGSNLFGAELWRANTKETQFHTAVLTRTKLEGRER
jgi:uncharacterized protein YjbI with pentapeptide repeats